MKVLVVGVGRMGSQIGCEYLAGGHDVVFLARDQMAAHARVRVALALASRAGRPHANAAPAPDVRSVLEPGEHVDLLVESLPEDFALKVAVLAPLATASPSALVASNTSSLSIGALGDAIGAAPRTLGTHYWNPPLLMPLVEVVAGPLTATAAVGRVCDLLVALGKRPVRVERDVPGFVWNRLQLAVMREALWLVEQGVATPATVDEIVREGLARRWRTVGPFAAAALGGAETWRRIGENILPALSRAENLESLERFLPDDAQELASMRERRDDALLRDLGGAG